MSDTESKSARDDGKKIGRTSGWYVLLLAWFFYAGAFFTFSKTLVKDVPDVTNGQMLDLAHRYAAFLGVGLGLLMFLVTGILYLIIRLIMRKSSRLVALILTALGYAPLLVFGWDLVCRELRYSEVARAIITYTGKPMFYSSMIVCGVALVGIPLTLVFKKRIK
jgi:hypothetical protein